MSRHATTPRDATRRLRALPLVSALLLVACGGVPRHPFEIAPGYQGAPEIASVFLAPINATTRVPEEFRAGRDFAFVHIKEHLTEHGKRMIETTPHRFRREWARATRGEEFLPPTKGEPFPPLPSAAAAKLFEGLSRYGDFDVLILTDLVGRPARASGTMLRWDGVRRRVEGMGNLSFRPGDEWRGVSLHVQGYDAQGRRVFHGLGGVDISFSIDDTQVQTRYAGSLREDNRKPLNASETIEGALTDPKNVQEGVRLAFDPLLPFGER